MTKPQRISLEQAKHVAHLARLSLQAPELERTQVQLDAILDYVAQLENVDVAAVPPTAHAVSMQAPLRDDQVWPSLHREEVLAAAPAARAGGFAVPQVLEGE